MPIGFTLPFARATGSLGYFESTNDEVSAVRENLKSLLVTNWGERVMNYNFGCNLIEFLFENEGDEELKSKIVDRITAQVATWMPFVSVDDVVILFPNDDPNLLQHTMRIQIAFRLNGRPDLSSRLDFVTSPGRA